jgi:gliding motility-associated-like protein
MQLIKSICTNNYFVFLLFFAQFSLSQTPISSFTTNPLPLGGNTTICSNSSVIFTNTSSQTNAQTTYLWNFGAGAVPATASGVGPHSVTYNVLATTSTSATLTVNNLNGQPTSIASQTLIINYLVDPSLLLTSVGLGFSTGTSNGNVLFKKCESNGPELFSFQSNYDNTINQTFAWGDGTSSNQTNMTGNQISHIFPIGQFTVTHTVTVGNCTKTTNYIVFNGSLPIISVSGSGQTTCLPSPYSIDIASNNVPINYTVSFSDGSVISTFSTANDTTISHIFNSSSCGVDYLYAPGVPPIQNAFSVSVLAQNFCSNGFPTVFTIGPITVSTGPTANFNFSPNSPICQNEIVSFENTSNGGENITENGCNSQYSYFWQILQNTGYSLTTGSLGSNNGFIGGNYDYSQWTSGTNQLGLSFDTPGTYNVTLYTANSCGIDSIMQEVIINPTATVGFSPSDQTICSGDQTTSITMTSTVPGYSISWDVTNISNVTGPIAMSGTGISPLILDPLTLFNSTNAIGTIEISATVGCSNVPPTIYTITVNPEGNIIATPIQSIICSGETTNITIDSNLPGGVFSWTTLAPSSITGDLNGTGSTINQTLINNGNSIDTVVYIISIGNISCPGPDVYVSVAVQPLITINQNTDITVCPGELINPNDYISTPAGATISWVNSNTLTGLGASGSGNIPTWTALQNTTGNSINGTITVNAQLNGCPSVQDEFIIVINPTPTFNYNLSPSTGLSCITNTATIVGSITPSNCSVIWSGPSILTGINSLTPVVNSPGLYSITITDNTSECTSIETVQIDPPTPINITQLIINSVSCFGGSNGSITVNTDNSSNVQYAWTPSVSTSQIANNLVSGTYFITVTNEDGCIDDTSGFVSEATPIVLFVADSIISECLEENGSITMNASGGQGSYSFVWSDGQNGATLSGIDGGSYTVVLTDNAGCTENATVILPCIPLIPIIIPQFISPNNDGKNDVWLIQNLEFYPDNKVTVYNRWGNIVFEAEPYNNDWNGHYHGTSLDSLPAATYFYVVDTKKKSQEPYTGYLEIQP